MKERPADLLAAIAACEKWLGIQLAIDAHNAVAQDRGHYSRAKTDRENVARRRQQIQIMEAALA